MKLKQTVRKNIKGASATLRKITSLELTHDEKGYLVTGFKNILNRWGNHFSQLLNVYGVNDVRQTERVTSD